MASLLKISSRSTQVIDKLSKETTLEALIEPAVNSLGCELWGLDYRPFGNSALLRIFIDKEGGISMDDCANVSHQVSGVLDVEEPITVAYTLEVSSPGIERPLLRPQHYQKYQGQTIKVRCKWPVSDRRKFMGTILSSTDTEVELQEDSEVVTIPLDAISKARLVVSLDD